MTDTNTGIAIIDEFSALPSRARRRQLRLQRDGKCRRCAAWLCPTHRDDRRIGCAPCRGWVMCEKCRLRDAARVESRKRKKRVMASHSP